MMRSMDLETAILHTPSSDDLVLIRKEEHLNYLSLNYVTIILLSCYLIIGIKTHRMNIKRYGEGNGVIDPSCRSSGSRASGRGGMDS